MNKLKEAFHYTVGKMCEEQEMNTEVKFGKRIVSTINEIAWRQLKSISKDVEAFSKHGKRSTVNLEDVKLLVRRNEELKAKLETTATVNTEENKAKRKKKSEPAAAAEFDFDSLDANVFS